MEGIRLHHICAVRSTVSGITTTLLQGVGTQRVHKEDVIGDREVERDSSCLQADEEHLHLGIALKCLQHLKKTRKRKTQESLGRREWGRECRLGFHPSRRRQSVHRRYLLL